MFERTQMIGRGCVIFDRLRFAAPEGLVGGAVSGLGLRGLPALINILRGDMSWVGPRAVPPGEMIPRERAARRRYNVRPGIICLWWIRRRGNMDYESEADVDAQYVETQSLKGDIGIALRAIPAMLYGEGVATTADEVTILNIRIDNLTMSDAVERIADAVEGGGAPLQVCFVNADCANIAYEDKGYLRAIRSAGLVLADGIGMKLAGKLLGREIRQNVNGTDLFPRMCEMLNERGKSVYFLGARPGVAETAAEWTRERYPALVVAGGRYGYFPEDEDDAVVQEIAASAADVLLVAFGAPRQDEWIARRLGRLGVRAAMGVGGLFDFVSGRIPRAPAWMREIGMEWLYRLIREPERMWKRYLVGNALFVFRALREKSRSARSRRRPNA